MARRAERGRRPAPEGLAPGFVLGLVMGGLLGTGPACGPVQAPVSLVIVTLDTTRADHLSCYGFPLPTSPRIDELARRGVLFETAYAPMSQTLPAHASLFTGRSPREHGAVHNNFQLPDAARTLAEELGERGYATAAVIGAGVLDRLSGIHQGFDSWSGVCASDTEDCTRTRRRAVEVTDEALAWADGLASGAGGRPGPFLLWVHYFDPHGPYGPPPEHVAIGCDEVAAMLAERAEEMGLMFTDPAQPGFRRQAETWCAYANDIRLTDHHVGRLLDGLGARGLMERTAVLVVGDHGQGLGQHGELAHGVNVYEELMRVPLVVVGPEGERAGTRVPEPVAMEAWFDGLRRLALGRGSGGDPWSEVLSTGRLRAAPVYMERPHYPPDRFVARVGDRLAAGPMLAVVANDHKLIRGPEGEELFRLSDDPFERRDIRAEHPDLAARLAALLDSWVAARPVNRDELVPVSHEQRAALEALGY